MSFDENPKSPDKMVDPSKPSTKVNFATVAGVLIFFVVGAIVIWLFARR